MSLKRLKHITEIIENAEEPMTKADIDAEYKTQTKKNLCYSTRNECIEYLLKEKKIKTVNMKIYNRDRTGYVWVK